jgi:hypothetical protein
LSPRQWRAAAPQWAESSHTQATGARPLGSSSTVARQTSSNPRSVACPHPTGRSSHAGSCPQASRRAFLAGGTQDGGLYASLDQGRADLGLVLTRKQCLSNVGCLTPSRPLFEPDRWRNGFLLIAGSRLPRDLSGPREECRPAQGRGVLLRGGQNIRPLPWPTLSPGITALLGGSSRAHVL